MKLCGAEIIVKSLLKENVASIFCYPGGTVIPLFDELYQNGREIQLIRPRHEQAGVHAADGYARVTGKTGVVIVTSGPGATNTITGIANAYMDSIPMVVITGQVPTSKIGSDAFQEADITGITAPITKANFLVTDIDELAITIHKAFYIAGSGRPGPVLVDIPINIQQSKAEYIVPDKIELKSYNPQQSGHPRQIKAALKMLEDAGKPLVLVGGGVNLSDSMELVNEFCDRFDLPVVSTLMGHGVNPAKEELYYGGIGMHGSVYGNYAVQNADLIIALGVRFSDRILGDPKSFAPAAKIIHIDIDPAEIGKNTNACLPIVSNIISALKMFLEADSLSAGHNDWIAELQHQKLQHPLNFQENDYLKPQFLVQLAHKYFPENTIMASDVGQNQMWVAQYFRFRKPRKLLTSGGLGTMGFALPAAIGAKIGRPENEVLMIAGDGGFQMNIQELMTVKKYDLCIKMIVIDNKSLGMVRQWQEILCEKRYAATECHDNPDFAEIARSIGIPAITVQTPQEAEETMKELAFSTKSFLVHALVDPAENVLPMVPAGRSLSDIMRKI